MSTRVTVNKRTVVHPASQGKAVAAAPDACKTPSPGGPVPIPYPNIAQSADTASGSKQVLVMGEAIMLKDSEFSTSTGDEAGTAGGGLVSSVTKGKAKFTVYSFDVKVEGKNVPRLGDAMTNNGNSPNTAAAALLQPNLTPDQIEQAVRDLANECENTVGQPANPKDCHQAGKEKHKCCEKAIREEQEKKRKSQGNGPPEVYSECAFSQATGQMVPRNNPFGNVPPRVPRLRQAIINQAVGLAKKMSAPIGGMIQAFMKGKYVFPDLVIPVDPAKPIDAPGNISAVYDFYFPCPPKKRIPTEKRSQLEYYDRLLKPLQPSQAIP